MHDFRNRTLKASDQSEGKRTSLSLEALDGSMHEFLIRILKETYQSEPRSSRGANGRFLNRIFKGPGQSELGSSRGPNACRSSWNP